MNETAKATKEREATIMREKAREATKEYRESLLDVFLLHKQRVEEQINELCEVGTHENLCICLEDANVNTDLYLDVFSKKEVLDLLSILNKMDKKNAMQLLKDFYQQQKKNYYRFFYFPEFARMDEILRLDQNAENAENFLDMKS